jgi:amidase
VGWTRGSADENIDDPELYDGAHVAVQIVGRRFQEEKVLALTEILGDALGKHVV